MSENILPSLPTAEQLDALPTEQKRAEIAPYLLDATVNYPEPFYLLEYNGVPFSTLGGIQALSGQKKNGKTFLLVQLMAAILGTDIERSRTPQYLTGLRVPERTLEHLGRLPTVLYVDTEMEKLNSAKVLRRVHWLCGWPLDVQCERFHVLWLRGITDVKDGDKVVEKAHAKRYRLIRAAIEVFNPDAVFIDGIRDIIGDFNDNAESADLVGELMVLAEQRQICIWNTLHMNPRPGNDDESKMRGHLGTELGNKITDTLVSIKSKSASGVTFTVKQNDARGKDMEDWKFEVNEDAGALGVPRIMSQSEAAANEDQREKNEVNERFKSFNWPQYGATYTDLEKHLRSQGITSNRQIAHIFDVAKEEGIIVKNEKKKYRYNGFRAIPNDKTEDLPFQQSGENDKPPF